MAVRTRVAGSARTSAQQRVLCAFQALGLNSSGKGGGCKICGVPDVTDVPDAFPDVTQMSQMSLIYLPDVSP